MKNGNLTDLAIKVSDGSETDLYTICIKRLLALLVLLAADKNIITEK